MEVIREDIVDDETGEIVAIIFFCPDVVGVIPKPFNLVMNGHSIGFFPSRASIRTAINEHQKK